MTFFRSMGLLMLLLAQPVVLLAEITEYDVLDTPLEATANKKSTPDSPQVSHSAAYGRDEGKVHFAVSTAKKGTVKEYLLGAGDTIEIKVFGQDDLNLTIRLDDSGVINYPFLGEITAVGVTASGLEQLIASGLKEGYLVSPHVNVSVVEYRPFYIKGQVVNPGSYPYQLGLTLAKAVTTAGGFSEFAAEGDIFVVREKDMQHHAMRITSSAPVHPGDTVTVNESFFYIDGEVNNPGKYPLGSALTVREAISLAGGLTDRASTDKIYIKMNKGALVNIEQDHVVRTGASIIVQQSFF